MKVLVAEDDAETRDYIERGLRELGHTVVGAADGRDTLFFATSEPFDAIILDRMLPGLDGMTILKSIRGAGVDTPVLMLTALARVEDRVEGLEAGADDYLVKPFAFTELTARLNALSRRPAAVMAETTLRIGDIELNRLKHEVRRGGQRVDLQPREYALLDELMTNAGRVVTRTMLLERVWDFHFDPKTNIVETHVSRLRSKLNAGFDHDPIQTVRGSGYLFDA
ncbi:response regulator transcription factor [Sphingomonas panacisoli]|uniref:Response regulator transcription factor n=1 Tax=Sphingomonas panacisoli TaxID=1813879 RepID=A0A5B8LM43_9SPHN|nr:response regulator transcription factor [Sphingomonas panacisoli]QDZ09156.1 response regulator transcription factor [Sphingomonas panacisoli]